MTYLLLHQDHGMLTWRLCVKGTGAAVQEALADPDHCQDAAHYLAFCGSTVLVLMHPPAAAPVVFYTGWDYSQDRRPQP